MPAVLQGQRENLVDLSSELSQVKPSNRHFFPLLIATFDSKIRGGGEKKLGFRLGCGYHNEYS